MVLNFIFLTQEEMPVRIVNLGGKISAETFTHVMQSKPSASEKYLMALAGGYFILHPDYISKCEEAGMFVAEDAYEFGNPKFLPSLAAGMKTDESLFQAAHKWRKWIHHEHRRKFQHGAFTGSTFIVASPGKVSQFSNILKTGGGRVVEVDLTKPIKPSVLENNKVNRCFIENPKMLSKENKEVLKKCNVTVENVTAIKDFLLSATVPSW